MAIAAKQLKTISLAGSVLELETTQSIRSPALKPGDAISLRVVCPVLVEGVELIPAGTAAVGVITGIEKCGCCDWPRQVFLDIDNVTVSEGPPVSLNVSVRAVDNEHSQATDKETAAAALMFPAAPLAVALFARRREHAVVRLEQRFRAVVCVSTAALP